MTTTLTTITFSGLDAAGLTPRHIIVTDAPSAKQWLTALAASPFVYHLDDRVVDCFEGGITAMCYLADTVSLCFELLGDDAAWEHYYEACGPQGTKRGN
jgi:hypothetical protein